MTATWTFPGLPYGLLEPGAYSATVSNVTASGYVWDGVATARSFALE